MPSAPSQFLPVVRELVRAYQAFVAHASTHIRQCGLTPSQFDIIATLGNTAGMSFKELGARTLITKGTLTGIIDRLEARRLVRRMVNDSDGRSQIVVLTKAGERLFGRIFAPHIEHLARAFSDATPAQLAAMHSALRRIESSFSRARDSLAK